MGVRIGKLKALLLPADLPVLIYDKISKRVDDVTAALVLYEVGWEVGARLARNAFLKHFEPPEALAKVPELLRWIGLDAEVVGKEVLVKESAGIASGCHFERGLVAGIMSGLCRAPWDATARVEGTACVIRPRVRGVSLEEVGDVAKGVRDRVQGEDLL